MKRTMMKPVVLACMFILLNIQFLYAGKSDIPDNRTDALKTLARFMSKSGATKDETERMVKMMEERKLSSETVLSVRKILESAEISGIPLDPLIHKAYEGMAKNVSEPSLVGALEKTRIRYVFAFRQAKELTDSKENQERIGNDIADCMAASVSEQHMERIAEQLRNRMKSEEKKSRIAEQTFDLTRTMARMGVQSKTVLDVVCTALSRDYSASDMDLLKKRLMDHAMAGSASRIAEGYAGAIAHGARAQDLGNMNDNGNGSSWGRSGSGSSNGNPSGGSGYSDRKSVV
jgi:uncharacterized membrane protein YgcG